MKIATGLLFGLGAKLSQCLTSLENESVGIRTELNVNREHMGSIFLTICTDAHLGCTALDDGTQDTVLLNATSRILSYITIQFLMLQNISYNHPIGPKKL
ncbi:hypothetical protein V1520DRAFT_13859 [Lipomyces starkeyi]|uniref:Uncharacterized protein n=1 Tax=Lipomyces starkeyi NRRL Y-11557 TaxID=675824 RepID=A0A1E3PZ57_LIPST|nr:hypothetical protein LIPSTDRAFT_170517 [Lipomyces starkeyi NRRL Y-11557]